MFSSKNSPPAVLLNCDKLVSFELSLPGNSEVDCERTVKEKKSCAGIVREILRLPDSSKYLAAIAAPERLSPTASFNRICFRSRLPAICDF